MIRVQFEFPVIPRIAIIDNIADCVFKIILIMQIMDGFIIVLKKYLRRSNVIMKSVALCHPSS